MPDSFEPKTEILPKAQQEIWPLLTPAPRLSFVLYGRTAVALHLGHRISVDFDFFRTEPLDKKDIETSFTFMRDAQTIQEDENTLVVIAPMESGPVKVSFFGGVAIGRINEPLRTMDATLLVASLEDLLATKLKAQSWIEPKQKITETSLSCFLRAFRSKRHWVVLPKCMARIPAFL